MPLHLVHSLCGYHRLCCKSKASTGYGRRGVYNQAVKTCANLLTSVWRSPEPCSVLVLCTVCVLFTERVTFLMMPFTQTIQPLDQ